MTAFNVVRFRVKPGEEQRFIDEHRKMRPAFKGFLGGTLIRTGNQTFCMVGEWRNFQSIVAARPQMIAFLDAMRAMLEELGGGLGVTDPVSGEAVAKLAATKVAKKRPVRAPRKAKRPAAKRTAAKRSR
jgi:quinol monooxygenase YgiN